MRPLLLAVALLLMTGHMPVTASDSCDVPLAWGDARGVSSISIKVQRPPTPWITNTAPRPVTVFIVLFQAQDGTVRVVSATSCKALATLTRS